MKELDKWSAVADQARVLFEFVEWYNYRKAEGYVREAHIYEFFDIDVEQLEKERAELLKKVQEEA